MPSICPSFFILGLVVAFVHTEVTSTLFKTMPQELNTQMPATNVSNSTIVTAVTTPPADTTININSTTGISNTTGSMNTTNTNSTVAPLTTKQKGNDSTTMVYSTTPAPITPPKSTKSAITTTKQGGTTAQPASAGGDSTGIIILVVIILVALIFGVACFCARKRGRRYSVDFTSRPDEANIPLSSMEPELPNDAVPQNGLQTFESAETSTKEPEAKPDAQEEQKAEADKSVVDPSAESAAPAPSSDTSQDKPKEDVAEPSPPAPVEPSVEEKTDDESAVSNKTSVESLKETNENNSNNADLSQNRDLKLTSTFWEVPLDSPV